MLLNVSELITYVARTLPYRDAVEILFFSCVVYYILLWLRKDTERNLLLGFYAYCALFFAAHYADLPTMQFMLFVSAPVIALLFVILHQETLQKNFIKLASPSQSAPERSPWVDELIKCCLTALNRHKESIMVIERNDSIKNLIHAPYYIYAELKKDVFDIMLEKYIPSYEYMFWINQQGKIVAINATWRTQIDETWISKEALQMHVWKQQALYFSSKTDALIFKINPLTRSFDFVIEGKIYESMNAEQASAFMKKRLLPNVKKSGKETVVASTQSSEKTL